MDTTRATSWSVTINNPCPDDEEAIALARQKGWKVEGQLEKGVNGTPHYQLMVKTPQVRFSAVKKQFPRAHIEVARNVAALANYVCKEETRAGELPTNQDKYPSLSRFWDLIYDKITQNHKGQEAHDLDWHKMRDTHILSELDKATEELIYAGYHVETIAVNPQTRSAFVKFARAILCRSYADSQTDRQRVQPPAINVEADNTTEDAVLSQEVIVPAYHPPQDPPSSPPNGADAGRPVQPHTVVC